MTLNLTKSWVCDAPRTNQICLVDLHKLLEEHLISELLDANVITHKLSGNRPTDDSHISSRLDIARAYLSRYATCSHVHTSRLHVALPCLGMNTPVTFYPKLTVDERFTGYENDLNVYKGVKVRQRSVLEQLDTIRLFHQLVLEKSILLQDNVMKHMTLSDEIEPMIDQLDAFNP